MADVQVIFRVDKEMLGELDATLMASGFKTRNEWFRHEVREFLEEMERKRAMKLIEKLTVEGMGEAEVALMVREWREKYKV